MIGWSPTSYYVELTVEISCLVVDLAHHVRQLFAQWHTLIKSD